MSDYDDNEPFKTKPYLVQEMEAAERWAAFFGVLKFILGLIAAGALLKYIFS